jgi:hypothetical protein
MEPSWCTPPPWRAFQRDQEHNLKHPDSVDLISTKQNKTNKLPSFIDRCTTCSLFCYADGYHMMTIINSLSFEFWVCCEIIEQHGHNKELPSRSH